MPRTPIAFLAVLAALAGCASPDALSSAAVEPIVITDPADLSYLNATAPTVGHVHDYWNGSAAREVVNQSQDTFAIYYAPWRLAFEPPDGSFVPQGADRVDVRVEWTGSVAGAPELWVRTAADAEPTLVGPLENAATVAIPVAEGQHDLPHQMVSGWLFEVHLPLGGAPVATYMGSVTLWAIAHRGPDPLPVFPPHADLWSGSSERPLLDATFDTPIQATAPPFFTICDPDACFPVHTPEPGRIVPYDADHVAVVLALTPDATGSIALRYRGADTRTMTPIEPAERDGATLVYRIPVDRSGDSPYATQSLWSFEPYVPEEPLPAQSFHGGYRITATAHREPPQP